MRFLSHNFNYWILDTIKFYKNNCHKKGLNNIKVK